MRIAVLLFSIALLSAAVPVDAALAQDAPAPAPAPKLEYLYLELAPLSAVDVVAVGKALTAVVGVKSAEWTVSGSEVKVVREVGAAASDALIAAAKQAGAKSAVVVPIRSTVFVFSKPLHCAGCIGAVNKALRDLKGVKEVAVTEALSTVIVAYDTRTVSPKDVESALVAIGKPATVETPSTR